jgi:hypothetical protein
MKAFVFLNVVSRYVFVLQAKRVLADNIENKPTKQVALLWTVVIWLKIWSNGGLL